MSKTYKHRKTYFDDEDYQTEAEKPKASPRAKKKLTEAEVVELMMKSGLG